MHDPDATPRDAATPPPSPATPPPESNKASKPPRRDYGPQLRSTLRFIFVVALLAAGGHWAWHQPFMAKPRAIAALTAASPPDTLQMPVEGVRASRVADTFGAPRGTDRRHEGVDIFAPRGTPVISATDGVVVGIRESGLGGKQVWVMGPGRQRHYYAHLDGFAEFLEVGDLVRPGDALGIVGDTGNARGTPPHLHYGVYASDGAYDPLPLLRAAADSGDAAR